MRYIACGATRRHRCDEISTRLSILSHHIFFPLSSRTTDVIHPPIKIRPTFTKHVTGALGLRNACPTAEFMSSQTIHQTKMMVDLRSMKFLPLSNPSQGGKPTHSAPSSRDPAEPVEVPLVIFWSVETTAMKTEAISSFIIIQKTLRATPPPHDSGTTCFFYPESKFLPHDRVPQLGLKIAP